MLPLTGRDLGCRPRPDPSFLIAFLDEATRYGAYLLDTSLNTRVANRISTYFSISALH